MRRGIVAGGDNWKRQSRETHVPDPRGEGGRERGREGLGSRSSFWRR